MFKHVAGREHFGFAELDDGVAVGVRRRHVPQDDAFAVEEIQLEARAFVGFARQRRPTAGGDPFGWCDGAFSCAMIHASCAASPM